MIINTLYQIASMVNSSDPLLEHAGNFFAHPRPV